MFVFEQNKVLNNKTKLETIWSFIRVTFDKRQMTFKLSKITTTHYFWKQKVLSTENIIIDLKVIYFDGYAIGSMIAGQQNVIPICMDVLFGVGGF